MDTNDEEGQSTAPSKDEVDDSNRKKTWFSVKTWRAGDRWFTHRKTNWRFFEWNINWKALVPCMLMNWNFWCWQNEKKKCLHDYSVAHLISLCDGELKHFTAITVSALVVTIIITCVPNQIKISISMV